MGCNLFIFIISNNLTKWFPKLKSYMQYLFKTWSTSGNLWSQMNPTLILKNIYWPKSLLVKISLRIQITLIKPYGIYAWSHSNNHTKFLLGNTNFHVHVPILFLNCKSLVWGRGILFYNPINRLTTIPNVVKNRPKKCWVQCWTSNHMQKYMHICISHI